MYSSQAFSTNSFNFKELSMKKGSSDYFALKPTRGSSPTSGGRPERVTPTRPALPGSRALTSKYGGVLTAVRSHIASRTRP